MNLCNLRSLFVCDPCTYAASHGLRAQPRARSPFAGALIVGLAIGCTVLLARGAFGDGGRRGEPEVDFARDIGPLLEEMCQRCHGRDEAKSGLRLHTRRDLLRGGDGGAVIVPGSAGSSRLIHVVSGKGELVMPPRGKRLSAEQVALLEAWIDQGAKWGEAADGGEGASELPEHWSLRPIADVEPPPVRRREWVANPIDAFILARLEEEGIEPSPPAERTVLIRRLHLDLLGLPPDPADTEEDLVDGRPHAYERLVARLLASEHFGERWGRHWLDAARYADSDGFERDDVRPHAWRYRDWVIDAFNRDLPYDRFIVEQLAGDLLPGAGTPQLVATGFHRNAVSNLESGVDQEQNRVEQVGDRTNTAGLVFLGLTVGCAQCHSHKYDPITQREYYELFAFFNGAADRNVPAPPVAEEVAYQRAREAWDLERRKLEAAAAAEEKRIEAGLGAWEAARGPARVPWFTLEPSGQMSAGGAALGRLEDGSILVSGNSPLKDIYTLVIRLPQAGISALQLELLEHDSLPAKGPGREAQGGFAISEIKLSAAPAHDPTASRRLAVEPAAIRGGGGRTPPALAFDGDAGTAWAAGGAYEIERTGHAVLLVPPAWNLERGTALTVTIEQLEGERRTLGRLRLSAASAPPALLEDPLPRGIEELLAKPAGERTAAEQEALRRFVALRDPRRRELEAALQAHRRAEPRPPETMAQAITAHPRPPRTHIHLRGDFLQKGDEVEPGTPAVLPPLRTRGEKADRLDLARWMSDPSHPLTARVEVNRIWEKLLGRGLVETSEDFGKQGSPPSHPELLDWLAAEFQRRGWSRKEMIKLITASSTYRQSSKVRPELDDRDPKNILLARQNRFRVEAEVLRDLFLAASGLLNRRVGGPGIRPPLPFEVVDLGFNGYVKWPESRGEDRYRRGLYIFFQRTVPYPMLMTFDTPDSTTSCMRRNRSNTPLQALTLLNDPVFVECAQAFSRRLLAEGPLSDRERLRRAFRICVLREPEAAEMEVLASLLAEMRSIFQAKPEEAARLAGNYRPEGVEPREAAAWMALGRMILNLDEFQMRE
jgi:mono/diheme cytochrome c family protein